MNNDTNSLIDNLSSVDKLLQSLPADSGNSLLSMDISMGGIALSILFSIVGMAYIRYGKKNGPFSTVVYGVVLLIYPYFIYDTYAILGIGILFSVLPFVVKFG